MNFSDNKEIVISIRDLSKKYKLYNSELDRVKEVFNFRRNRIFHKEHLALNSVNLELHKGETIGLIGKNGAGKSTLLKILTGIIVPTKGEVNVKGKVASLLELGAGFNVELTGLENIYLNGTLMGFTKSQIEEKLDTILKFADIGDFIDQPVKRYSSGMFARLAFSVAINVEPDILIIDEALSVGDLRFQLKCMEKFDDFRESGKTIIFVSHDINAIKRFCTYTVWIKDGSIMEQGNTDFVTDRYLDYLKLLDSPKCEKNNLDHNNDIAKITKVNIKNSNGVKSMHFSYLDDIFIEIEYDVFDDSISNPVLGISINTLDNKNVCGLNTLLDNVMIPWVNGPNKLMLCYKNISLIGGTYSVDSAIFEKNASVSFDYKHNVASFSVKTPYIAEGVYVMEHYWIES